MTREETTMQRPDPWFWRSAERFRSLRLEQGDHPSSDAGLCLMEAVAWLAREPHSDHPACTCPVLASYGRSLNDVLDDERRQRLKPLIPAVIGTVGDGHADRRGLMAADWIIRTYTPTWLRLAGLDDEAAALEALPEVVDTATMEGALSALNRARASAAAARAAAWAAAWDAAWDAAGAAAWDAARAAAWDAAGAAAWEKVRPTAERLQDDAIRLYERMIALGAEDRVVRALPGAPESAPERTVPA